jgi:subtilase family serine protease
MTRRWIVSAVAAVVAGPLAAVVLVGAPFANAGPTSASRAPRLYLALAHNEVVANDRAAISYDARSLLPRLTADGAGFMRDGAAPRLPAHSRLLSAVAVNQPLEVDLALVPRNPEALAEFATNVSTPGSSVYRHYINPTEFGQRYGATPAAIAAVREAMMAAGLHPERASVNGLELKVTGTAGEFERAFSTALNHYRLVGGTVGIANTLAPRIATSAARYVSAVVGLNTLLRLEPLDANVLKSHSARTLPQASGTGMVASATSTSTTTTTTTTSTVSTATTPATATTTTPATSASYANGPTPCNAAVSFTNASSGTVTPVIGGTPPIPEAGVIEDTYDYDSFAKAYDFDGLYREGALGQGVNVGIFELEPNFPADPIAFDNCYGIPTPVHYISVDGAEPAPDASDSDGLETALDIETIAALAPDSNITVYQGNENAATGWLDTFNAIVSQDADKVVNVSYGVCEQLEAQLVGNSPEAEVTLFEEAATQGQTFAVSSGDSGAEGCRLETNTQVPAVGDPGADPFVTGVGGTSLQAVGNPPTTQPTEVVWNNGTVFDTAGEGGAGGGGLSTVWLMPGYQTNAAASLGVINSESEGLEGNAGTICSGDAENVGVPDLDPSTVYCREDPDVSASADPYYGFTVYYDGSWSSIGGTSGAAPIWTALFADADSTPNCQADPIGFANPALYAIGSSPTEYARDFNDITTGDNDMGASNGGWFDALTGYDMASGLGSPIAANLVADLCPTPSTTGTPTGTTVTDTVTTPGTTQTQTVTTPGSTQTVASTQTQTVASTQTQTVTSTQTQTVTSTQTQTVTTPLQTVTTPGPTATLYEYTSGGCARDLGFAVKPHSDRLRSVKVKLYVNNKLMRTYKGHALKTVKLTHPKHSKFRVTLVSTLSNGEVVGQVLQFDGCTYYTTKWVVLEK